MSKQNNKSKPSHKFDIGGDFGISGTLQFVNGLASNSKERKANEETYNNAIDNTRIGFNGISSLNNYDSLEDYLNSAGQLHELETSDLIGNNAHRIGKFLSTSSQAMQAGSNFGPWGALAGAVVGQIGAGISGWRNRKKAERSLVDINQKIRDTNALQTAMVDNKLNNIMANQMADQQWDYIAALGGNLHSNSTTWSNGLNYIGSGGSHESNPNDGVAISTAPDGLQNKVEEGEVVWNDDYVFSKRLKVPKKDLEKNKWKGETYADIAKKLMDESAERPNDPITLRGLDDSLSRLRDSQEELKAKQEGNKIKKEIASMPPELLAQMQQAQQQPTEEEIMQQQVMEQIPQEQMPMVDPSMQQPTMEQPTMYAKGGPLKGGPGKFVHLSDESKYDYAVNKKPIAAIFDDIFQKNKNKRQPLIYKKEHIDPEDQNVINEEIDYSLDNLNKEYNQSRYIGFDEQEDIEKNKFAKGGHLFPDGGVYAWPLYDKFNKPNFNQGLQYGSNLNASIGQNIQNQNDFSIGKNIAANSNGMNNHTLGVELNGNKTTTDTSKGGMNKGAMFGALASGIDMTGAVIDNVWGNSGGNLDALYKGKRDNKDLPNWLTTAWNGYTGGLYAKGGNVDNNDNDDVDYFANAYKEKMTIDNGNYLSSGLGTDLSTDNISWGYAYKQDFPNDKMFWYDKIDDKIHYPKNATRADSAVFQHLLNKHGLPYGEGPATKEIDELNAQHKYIQQRLGKYAKGGHLYKYGDELNFADDKQANYPSYYNYLLDQALFEKSLDDITGSRRASNAGRTLQLLSDARKLKMAENAAERKEKIKNAKNKTKSALSNLDETSLRYAPVWGSIFNVARSIASRPDYGNPERIERAAARVGAQVSPKYIGDYLRYRPLDEAYYLNQLNAQQNAANNAIVGLSNGNRSMALASMLANDYNYNNQRGAAYRQGLEYNEAQRQRAAEFNRGTNQFNAQQYMQAAAQNASNRAQAANLIASAAQMREAIDNAYGASQSANWTSLFNNLGAVGKDRMNWNMAKDIYDYQTGRNGEVKYKPAAKGGYLTIKTNNRRKE